MRPWTFFLPALCLFPVWLAIGIREGILISSVSKFYPMMLAMILGSMIAGSTPLGGGIVAFPVSVLVLGFSPSEGRDFSLMIQSVGMTAASFLIFYRKRHLLRGCEDLVANFCLLSIIGVIVGLELLKDLSPYIVNIVYTTTVACIAIVLAYADFINVHGRKSSISKNASCDKDEIQETRHIDEGAIQETRHVDIVRTAVEMETDAENSIYIPTSPPSSISNQEAMVPGTRTRGNEKIRMILQNVCLPFFALAGGILSSQIGTGADISCFFYGSLYNFIMLHGQNENNKPLAISENTLTAASVIVMANTSIFGSILRLTTTKQESSNVVNDEVYAVLMACSPIVVLGAPIGSLFLTQSNKQLLKYLFYALAILQLLSFGIIKISHDHIAWAAIAGVMTTIISCLLMHRLFF